MGVPLNCAETSGKFAEPKKPPSMVKAPEDGAPAAVCGKLLGAVEIKDGRSEAIVILNGPPLEFGVQVLCPIGGLQMLIVCAPAVVSCAGSKRARAPVGVDPRVGGDTTTICVAGKAVPSKKMLVSELTFVAAR